MIRIINGDCMDYLHTIADNSVNLVICDLPYGLTDLKWDKKIDLAELWVEIKRVLVKMVKHADGSVTKCGQVLMFCQGKFKYEVYNSNPRWHRQDLVWIKHKGVGFMNANVRRLTQHEDILLFSSNSGVYNPQKTQGKPYVTTHKPHHVVSDLYRFFAFRSKNGFTTVNSGDRFPTTILRHSKEEKHGGLNKGNPTSKPLAIIEDLIKTYSNEGDVVLDPTAGSGTVIEACVKLNRDVIAIELDPKQYGICIKRACIDVQKDLI